MCRFDGRVGAMERFKLVLPFVPGVVLFLVNTGLQVSGITNVVLAIALWGLAAILLVWAAWHSFNLSSLLLTWQIQAIHF